MILCSFPWTMDSRWLEKLMDKMTIKTLNEIPPHAKTALVRVDLNVPMEGGKVLDSTRLKRILATLNFLTQKGIKVCLISHLGRPSPSLDSSNWDMNLSLGPVGRQLEVIWGNPVHFIAEPSKWGQYVHNVALLENLRFLPGEEKDDPDLAKALALGADIYVNEAFSCSHRAHSSIHAITKILPSYGGINLIEEMGYLEKSLIHPQKPLVAIVGGAKVSTKLAILENLAPKVDQLIIGGAMANTFLVAQGYEVGKSRVEADLIPLAQKIITAFGDKILLPLDRIDGLDGQVRQINEALPETDYVDIGPETVKMFGSVIERANTLVWNGPLGFFEVKPYDEGTNQLAKMVAYGVKNRGLCAIAGGGDTVSALVNAGVENDFSFISTAGGAFLEWLEGRELPGIRALNQN